LHAAHIAPGDVESSALVVAYLAYARLALGNRATVAAGVATNTIAVQFFVQVALSDVLIYDFAKGRHSKSLSIF